MHPSPFLTVRATGRARLRLAVGLVVGAALIAGGLALGFLMLGTPFLAAFTPTGRPEPGQAAVGALAWAVALIAPAAVLVVGAARMATVVDAFLSSRPRQTPASRLAAELGAGHHVAARVRLPDGRVIPELVIGPFGAAVIEELPPARVTRRRGTSWEVLGPRGQWLPFENPLDRATRDAERVRRWAAHEDHDFVLKVYPAVVSSDPTVERTASCAVIAADQIPAWLRSLPLQRSLTEGRRTRLVELLTDPG
jgi:hypothetical protein